MLPPIQLLVFLMLGEQGWEKLEGWGDLRCLELRLGSLIAEGVGLRELMLQLRGRQSVVCRGELIMPPIFR